MITELNQEYDRLLTVVQPKVIETEEENEFYLAEVSKLMQLGEFFKVSPTLFFDRRRRKQSYR